MGGCIYCNDRALYPEYGSGTLSEQIMKGMAVLRRKYNVDKFIVYFQSNTNTYADVDKLREIFLEAISYPSVVGIAIGTRPDCVSEEILDMLRELRSRTYLWMEYGLQSASDETLRTINRCHTVNDFIDAVMRTHTRGIEVCAHVIIGLPGEEREHVLRTAELLSDVGIDGVKIHAFHILKDTVAEKWYNNKMIKLLSMDEYAGMVVDMIERFPERVVIHRLTGEAPEKFLVAPEWVKRKLNVINKIKETMRERKTYQGRLFQERFITQGGKG